jgi:hypothetical protein
VLRFTTEYLTMPVPSPVVFAKTGDRFRHEVKAFAARHRIPDLQLKKPDRIRWDDRKLYHVRPYLDRDARGRLGVVAMVASQELDGVFSVVNRSTKAGVANFDFPRNERRVGMYYLYILDRDFGPGFIKICTYFPVRHEAPYNRVGCKDPPVACRSRSLNLEAA